MIRTCHNNSIGCHGAENANLPDADICEYCQVEAIESRLVSRDYQFEPESSFEYDIDLAIAETYLQYDINVPANDNMDMEGCV